MEEIIIIISFGLSFKKTLHKINLLDRNKSLNSEDAMQDVNKTGKLFCYCHQSSGQPLYDQNTTFYLPAFSFPTI